MKISRIKIENFRSIQQAEFFLGDFNIFVGQNNCGKTNFFEAIDFFFKGLGRGISIDELKYKRDPNKKISVEIEFNGALQGATVMKNQANKTKIENALNGNDIVIFRRECSNPKKRR